MITIRAAQLAQFSVERKRALVLRLCVHLHAHFAPQMAAIGAAALHGLVGDAVARAASYDLHSERDCCRFVNLAAVYGWDFDQRSDTAWMQSYLLDTSVSVASQRLQRLADECLRRRAMAAARRQLQFDTGLAWDDEHDDDITFELKYDPGHPP